MNIPIDRALDRDEDTLSGKPTYQSVIEAPGGAHHVHWFVHVPDDLRVLFERKLPTWVRKTCGAVTDDAALHVESITDMGIARYCMKGVEPQHASRCYVRPENQGEVFGKRVGISRSLGPRARMQERSTRSATGSPSPARSGAGRGHAHGLHP